MAGRRSNRGMLLVQCVLVILSWKEVPEVRVFVEVVDPFVLLNWIDMLGLDPLVMTKA